MYEHLPCRQVAIEKAAVRSVVSHRVRNRPYVLPAHRLPVRDGDGAWCESDGVGGTSGRCRSAVGTEIWRARRAAARCCSSKNEADADGDGAAHQISLRRERHGQSHRIDEAPIVGVSERAA